MKENILNILNEYLLLFPEEKEIQKQFLGFVLTHNNEEITDWNNFDGHIVASGFVYAKQDKKFLVLYHNDFKMYVYPGGHVDEDDKDVLSAAKREIKEETGLDNITLYKVSENEMVPLDIDTHHIGYNERLRLPEHYHYDFRYLFTIDKIDDVKIDESESSDYKWIDIDELCNNLHSRKIIPKLRKYIEEITREI